MSVAAHGAIGAITFQLAGVLDRYEDDMACLVETWFDMDVYRRASEGMDEIQRYSASVPGISVPAVALLIAHSELVHALWREEDSTGVLAEHAACVRSLRRACLRKIARHVSAAQ